MIYPDPRAGIPVSVRGQELDFSFFPVRQNRRWGRQPMLYAADVWGVIDSSLEVGCKSTELSSARSFVRQSSEYYAAADRAAAPETRPLLYYYGLLNLVKALAMSRGRPDMVGKVNHGIAHSYANGESVDTAILNASRSGTGPKQVFDELHRALTGAPLPTPLAYNLADLIPQSVVGHRLWLQATNRTRELFVPVERIRMLQDTASKAAWTTLEVDAEMLKRSDRGVATALEQSGLSDSHRIVKNRIVDGTPFRVFEQTTATDFTHRAADAVTAIVSVVRPRLWRVISSTPPYRRHYLFLNPPGGADPLPQICSAYALIFFLGSLTRYHPAYLLEIMDGRHGAFFREFLATQPQQLLFSLASEFQRQEVSRAAVV